MTDAELIARLRELDGWVMHGARTHLAAADRIEALIAERDEAFGEWDKAIVLADKAAALMNKMDTRRIAAEAKLAKAVECLTHYATCPIEEIRLEARATLAEIKGESHE